MVRGVFTCHVRQPAEATRHPAGDSTACRADGRGESDVGRHTDPSPVDPGGVLDRIILFLFGERHIRHVITEFVEHYHRAVPRLGGLLNFHEQAA